MSFMIISMYSGMSIGLTLGVMLGALYQGDLYTSTLFSIGAGAVIGFLIGIIHSTLSSIEGLMSGLMGGMMGAMLGEMISTSESIMIIKFLLLLSVISVFLYFILPQTKPAESLASKGWLFKPLAAFLVIGAIFVFSEKLFSSAPLQNLKAPADENHHESAPQHHHNNTKKPEEKQTIKIIASDMRYQPSIVTISKDTAVKFVFQNQDNVDHDIEIKTKTTAAGQGHGHHTSQGSFHLHAEANSSSQQDFLPAEKGVYVFYCTIPGHKENGMTGTLIVQ
ncbi:cupredoxin domain-containing protein [Bacillus sp. SCS-153A]|uniref:cupredoxin domain-containing protein n=1 Tax=Rossellomorea sedimentorum TaxID=3115294 RepID=UPI003906543B